MLHVVYLQHCAKKVMQRIERSTQGSVSSLVAPQLLSNSTPDANPAMDTERSLPPTLLEAVVPVKEQEESKELPRDIMQWLKEANLEALAPILAKVA